MTPDYQYQWRLASRLLPRDAMHKRCLGRHAVSVCPSVCLSRSYILSKQINIYLFFTAVYSHAILVFAILNVMKIFRRDPRVPPPNGASNAGGVGTNRDYRQIAGYRSMTAAVRTTAAIVHRAAYRRDCHASVNLCLLQPWTTTTKRREEKRIYLYAATNLKRK